MKNNIIKLYNNVINYLIEFFHVIKLKCNKLFKRIKKKIKKFYYYEILGVLYISVMFYRLLLYIHNYKFIKIPRDYVKDVMVDFYKYILEIINEYKNKYDEYLKEAKNKNNERITNIKNEYSKFMTPRIMVKVSMLAVLSVFLIYDAYSWFYSEYVSKGTQITMGTVTHIVNQYDEDGVLIGDVGDILTVVEEDNLSVSSTNTRYIEIKNTGSLDIDYTLSFTLDSMTTVAGNLYYRVFDITDEVISSTITATYDTKLKAYAALNPRPANLETNQVNPCSNMTTIPQKLVKGTIEKDTITEENNSKYYRIDYGVSQLAVSSLYSGQSLAIHANVYSVQSGIDEELISEGQIWLVENESQFRDAALNALSGDTIKLADNVTVQGNVDFSRRVHIDTDTYNLHITGDLVYDFVEVGVLNIDTSGGGKIDVDVDFYVGTPKSQVHFIGENNDYDIFVGGMFTVNGIQNDEEDGVLLEAIQIIKNKVGNVPVDMIIESNTRVTIAPNVTVGYVIGATGSTNIEILNNGTITQIQLQNMTLIDSFSKYQIYVYNLNTILGVLGGSSIILPSNSTPYTGPNTGNTLIIAGVSSNSITVSGSTGFGGGDIGQGAPEDSVIPIQGEPNSYYVYIRSNSETLQGLLEAYFDEIDENTTDDEINAIKKLVIYTINSSYFENEDFTYMASSAMSSIEHLNLANATITDGNTVNQIANNTLSNKTTLKTLILSKTTAAIGSGAFQNVTLGRIPSSGTFTFLTIPSTVTSIGTSAFASSRYVKFEGQIPPVVGLNAFDNSTNGTKFFVPQGAIETYRNAANINEKYVYYQASLSDNKLYFLYDYEDGYGISYFISSVSIGNSLVIPNTATVSAITKNVTALGYNSFRNIITDSSGVAMTIPSTVTLIDSYAFHNVKVNTINLSNVERVNSYAFYSTNLSQLVADNIDYIGDHAFYANPITYLSLEHVDTIMPYAFTNNTTLYEMNLGTIKVIGDYAFFNCPQLGRIWFKNTDTVVVNNGESIDLTVGENAVFTNWGMYLDGRLRVYVPVGDSATGLNYLAGYKDLFQANESFIYPTGTIMGSYQHVAIPYDFGEYSIRSVTKNNALGQSVTAYEIIEYHGADLSSSYQIPDIIVSDPEVTASITGSSWLNGSVYTYNGTLTINNNTDNAISDWTVRINLPSGISGFTSYTNMIQSLSGNIMTVSNQSYNGSIAAHGSRQVTFAYNTTSQSISASVINAYSSGTPLMEIISIGEYAYRHVNSVSGQTINITANSLLNIDNHGLENVSVSSITANNLVSIGNYGLYNTGLNHVTFPALNSLGEYAMSGMNTLYSADLGTVKVLRTHAISDNPNLEQLFFRNEDIQNMTVHETALENIGTNVNNRMRIYVPDNGNCINFYNQLLSSYSDYIYPIGDIVGSYINSPIPYDIGEYAVRTVNIEGRDGTNISGYEIIEYHGADLPNTYQVPESFTINGVTKDVISVGDYAYRHTTSVTGANIHISNNVLISIGAHAFENLEGIVEFESESLLHLNEYAFNNSSLNNFDAPNLFSIGSYALANMGTLYRINLGKVAQMDSNSLYTLDNLVQVFFDPHEDTLILNRNAITDVGTQTSNRIRFYVNQAEYLQQHQQTYPRTLDVSYVQTAHTTSGNGVNTRHQYTFRVRVTNNNADDVASWETTMDLKNNGDFIGVTNAEYSEVNGDVTFTNTASNGTIEAGSYVEFNVNVNTTNRNTYTPSFSGTSGIHIDITYTESLVDMVSTYANSFRNEYKDYFYVKGTIVGNYTSSNIPYDIGLYSVILVSHEDTAGNLHYGYEFVEYHGPDINNAFIVPTSLDLTDTPYAVVSIGDRAFRWATMNGNNTFDLVNTSLISIGDYAFYDLEGIKVLNVPNVDEIGDYAFYNNKLYTATTTGLVSLGAYAYANNTALNYVNFGPATIFGEGALYGCTAVEQMYFTSTDADSSSNVMNFTLGTNVFYNTGTTIGKRLRVYVPNANLSSGASYQTAYKQTLPATIAEYIHPTGYIVGSYTYGSLPYDIGEYSVRKVTLRNTFNANVTGWELIEYHGQDVGTNVSTLLGSITAGGETLNLISIGNYAFYGVSLVSGQTWNLTLPNSVFVIEHHAFYKTSIASITANQIAIIGQYAFADCESLTTAVFSSAVALDDYAFYSCGSISYISLGTGTTSLGAYSLWNPYQGGPSTTLNLLVTSVPNTASTALPDYERGFLGLWYNSHLTVSVPSSALSPFQNATPWRYHNFSSSTYSSNFLYVLDNNNEIMITSYTGNDSNVTIPDTLPVNSVNYNVTSIKGDAFDSNNTITSLTLPRYLTSLGDGFLDGNTTIVNLNANANSTVFRSDNGVLLDNTQTTIIKYPNGKTTTDYTTPTGITGIGYRAFANHPNLDYVTFLSSINTIGAYAFDGCSGIISYTFEGNVPKVTGFGAFQASASTYIYVRNANLATFRSNTYFQDYYDNLRGY